MKPSRIMRWGFDLAAGRTAAMTGFGIAANCFNWAKRFGPGPLGQAQKGPALWGGPFGRAWPFGPGRARPFGSGPNGN